MNQFVMSSLPFVRLIIVLATTMSTWASDMNISTTTMETPRMSDDLKILGIEVPTLPAFPGVNFSAPAFGPLPCTSTSSFRFGFCSPDPTCGGKAIPDGPCALNLGTCCTPFSTCGSAVPIITNVSILASPEYPAAITTAEPCQFNILANLLSSQIRIDFLDLELGPIDPVSRLCTEDWLEISGTVITLPRLCGSLTGQHIYIPLTATITNVKIVFNFSPKSLNLRKFKIKVTQLEKGHWNVAPAGCLQYHQLPSGQVTSLPMERTNSPYGICFKQSSEICSIQFTPVNRVSRSLDVVENKINELTKDKVDLLITLLVELIEKLKLSKPVASYGYGQSSPKYSSLESFKSLLKPLAVADHKVTALEEGKFYKSPLAYSYAYGKSPAIEEKKLFKTQLALGHPKVAIEEGKFYKTPLTYAYPKVEEGKYYKKPVTFALPKFPAIDESKFLKVPKLGVPSIPGYPIHVVPKPIEPLKPEFEVVEKDMVVPVLPKEVAVVPGKSATEGVLLTDFVDCKGQSSLISAAATLCQGNIRPFVLSQAPFIIFISEDSQNLPLSFALSYQAQPCSVTSG